MILRYYGHSLFTLTLNNATVILTDPYGSFCRYPARELSADIVTISHHHYDHDSMDIVRGKPIVIDEAGYFLPADDVIITGVPTFHDNHEGTRRGRNVAFSIEAEGMKIVHLGDLGHLPAGAQKEALSGADVLMIPVGGTYTLNPERAYLCVQALAPRVTIPMHYKTRFSEDLGIAPVQEFLDRMGESPKPQKKCKLSKDTIRDMPSLVLMDIVE